MPSISGAFYLILSYAGILGKEVMPNPRLDLRSSTGWMDHLTLDLLPSLMNSYRWYTTYELLVWLSRYD